MCHPCKKCIGRILAFIQLWVEIKLALGMIKGQISALFIFFRRTIASHSLVKAFLQGIICMVLPVRPPLCPLNLNLVLTEATFWVHSTYSSGYFNEKIIIFLVAVPSARRVSELAALSCRKPFLILHQDGVVLQPTQLFLPKISSFHLNQDITPPWSFPNPSPTEEKLLHSLDVVWVVKVYLEMSAQIH